MKSCKLRLIFFSLALKWLSNPADGSNLQVPEESNQILSDESSLKITALSSADLFLLVSVSCFWVCVCIRHVYVDLPIVCTKGVDIG